MRSAIKGLAPRFTKLVSFAVNSEFHSTSLLLGFPHRLIVPRKPIFRLPAAACNELRGHLSASILVLPSRKVQESSSADRDKSATTMAFDILSQQVKLAGPVLLLCFSDYLSRKYILDTACGLEYIEPLIVVSPSTLHPLLKSTIMIRSIVAHAFDGSTTWVAAMECLFLRSPEVLW